MSARSSAYLLSESNFGSIRLIKVRNFASNLLALWFLSFLCPFHFLQTTFYADLSPSRAVSSGVTKQYILVQLLLNTCIPTSVGLSVWRSKYGCIGEGALLLNNIVFATCSSSLASLFFSICLFDTSSQWFTFSVFLSFYYFIFKRYIFIYRLFSFF